MIAWCETEAELGVIGAVAAAGRRLCRALCRRLGEGGEALGFEPGLAEQIADPDAGRNWRLCGDTGDPMAEIARRVASPKGTTEQGLAVLDAPDGLQPLVDRTFAAADPPRAGAGRRSRRPQLTARRALA